jgi:hypothetical protein
MGTSWVKRHRDETDDFKAAKKKAYSKWKAEFTDLEGKWNETKIQKWLKEYRAAKFPDWPVKTK